MAILKQTSGLHLEEGECTELLHSGKAVVGVQLADGRRYLSGALVLTAGTFLNGIIHRGEERFSQVAWGIRPR